MVYISQETTEQTHRRLLSVIAQAELKVFKNSYAWREFPLDSFPPDGLKDALAYVRDDYVWSGLAPSNDAELELFKIVRFHFPPGVDNSGFVGWLASHLKRKLGSGVFVTCGQNSSRGGIFDYTGCPLKLGEAIVAEITKLRNDGMNKPSDHAVLSLDGRRFNATVTAPSGVINKKTFFEFHQEGKRVWSEYAGGQIERGYLVGTLDGATLTFRYAQMQTDGVLDGGISTCEVEHDEQGRLQIVEHFEWASREGGGSNVLTETF